MSLKAKIRGATVGSKKQFKEESFEIEGEKVLVRQPSIKIRKALFKNTVDENGNIDNGDFLIYAIINMVKDDEGEQVFTDEDYEAIVEQPTGSWADKLGEVCLRLLNVEGTGKKATGDSSETTS